MRCGRSAPRCWCRRSRHNASAGPWGSRVGLTEVKSPLNDALRRIFRGCQMSASIGQTLVQKIDDSREKAVAFLQQMIAIPSVTGDEAKIQKFLADYMTKIG